VSQVAASPEPFSARQTGVEVAAGDSTILEVVFSPSAEGDFSGNLTFTTDDPDHTQFTISLTGVGKSGELQVVCDFNGDGKKLINDVIAYLLYAKEHPEDLARLDWNGDGKYAINDAIMFLINLIQGTCPDALVELAGATDEIQAEKMEGLTQADIGYIEEMMALMDLTEEQEAAFRVALYGQAGMAALPEAMALDQNYPNPFNPATVISYAVPLGGADRRISIKVYDIRGALVRVLVDGIKQPGSHTVYWDGTDKTGRRVSSGIYLYRLRAGDTVFTRKMVVVN